MNIDSWGQMSVGEIFNQEFRDPFNKDSGRYSGVPATIASEEITLFDQEGRPVAYIDFTKEPVIYLWNGQAVAYLWNQHVYGFNGKHLGWFEGEVVINHQGEKIGFTKPSCPGMTKAEPAKMDKLIQKIKSIKEMAPLRPVNRLSIARENFVSFLNSGR